MFFPDPAHPVCTCKSIERYARERVCAIEFDEDYQRYVLVARDGSEAAMIYFCFHCGGRVAEPVELEERSQEPE